VIESEKTVKACRCSYLDALPADGQTQRQAYRARIRGRGLELTRGLGIGAQFGGKISARRPRDSAFRGMAPSLRSASAYPVPRPPIIGKITPRASFSKSARPTPRGFCRRSPTKRSATRSCRSIWRGRWQKTARPCRDTRSRPARPVRDTRSSRANRACHIAGAARSRRGVADSISGPTDSLKRGRQMPGVRLGPFGPRTRRAILWTDMSGRSWRAGGRWSRSQGDAGRSARAASNTAGSNSARRRPGGAARARTAIKRSSSIDIPSLGMEGSEAIWRHRGASIPGRMMSRRTRE